jgi:uncharacterized protein YndB with AHSA1/START domain
MSEFTITRTLKGSRERVWKVLTRPEDFEQWLPAEPGTAVLDVRSGGSWAATVTSSDGEHIPLTGQYMEVSEPERLVMTVPGGAVSDMTLIEETPGATTVVYRFGELDDSLHGMVTESVDDTLGRVSAVLDS